MISDKGNRPVPGPALWLSLSMVLTMGACALFAFGFAAWGVLTLLGAITCAVKVSTDIRRLRRRVVYLVTAAMNGDFSYKFPVSGVSEQEKEINLALNQFVSHLERLSMEAKENEAFLGLVINLIDSGIIVADSDGRVIKANKAALNLLSVPVLTDIRGIPMSPAGLHMSSTPCTLRGEKMTIYTVSDMRRQLQAAEVESWEKLTRVLTHEIMNSLTPVTSIAETLCSESYGLSLSGEEVRQQMEVILSGSRALMEFVRNFRKFTILPEPKPQVFYIRPFLQKMISLAKATEGSGQVEFTLSVFPPDAMAYADENMLSRVILNILKNAVEASSSMITVEADIRDDESVEITLANNGDVIPEEIASKIFTPFFTTKSGGSGIGLSLSRRIIDRLGGTLSLTTRPHTRFTIRL